MDRAPGQTIEDALVVANRLSEVQSDGIESALRQYEALRQQRRAVVMRQLWLIGARGQGLLDPETVP